MATGMAKVTEKINEMTTDANTSAITQIAYETIGAEKSPCNFSDFCSDFDAIKITLMLDELIDSRVDTEYKANGAEFVDLLENYYTNHFQYRFAYVCSDLKCNLDVDLETLNYLIYNKMIGVDEGIGLLPTFGKSPTAPVIEACSRALAQYIIQEIGNLTIDIGC